MAKVLVVLPFSGVSFGGGLAVLNQKLIHALANLKEKDKAVHEVKFLTFDLPKFAEVDAGSHAPAQIIKIANIEVSGMKDFKGSEENRNRLYELINDWKILEPQVAQIQGKDKDKWTPDVIIGHSRFSGPAAVMLKREAFHDAKVAYLLHSYPVEGAVLVGYDVYGESIDNELAQRKLEAEKEWMVQADVVAGVGPLLEAGAELLLVEAKADPEVTRLHQCIAGIELTSQGAVAYKKPDKVVNLLFMGRASAPIKGVEDFLLALLKVHELKDKEKLAMPIRADVRFWATAFQNVSTKDMQDWTNGVLNLGTDPKKPTPAWEVKIKDGTSDPNEVAKDYRAAHLVLMPSYIEHFGLVPFEALGHGVPVLVNEISGAAMFLGDKTRFGDFGTPCVVQDFTASRDNDKRPLAPELFLKADNVLETAFDKRPDAWADAIIKAINELEKRWKDAEELCKRLAHYSYEHLAHSLVEATLDPQKKYAGKRTYQGPDGTILVR